LASNRLEYIRFLAALPKPGKEFGAAIGRVATGRQIGDVGAQISVGTPP